MNILLINHEFPPVGGGAATVCRYMAEYLGKKTNAVDVVTSNFKGLPRKEIVENYIVYRIFCGRKKVYKGDVLEAFLFLANGAVFLVKKVKTNKPDLTLAFFTLPGGFLAFLLKKIYKIPYFVFLRGMEVPGFYGGKFSYLNILLRPLIRYIWINADEVIANSQSLKNLALKTLATRTIHVIPNAVNLEFFSPSKIVNKDRNLKILYTGRLNKQKAINYLLDAVALIVKNGLFSFILEIVGDGVEKQKLIKKSVELNISDRIIFSGWVERSNLLKKYQDADIFVTTSVYEGMPNSVLEAMACGLPIIASDIPPHREIIEHGKNGLLAPPRNAKAVADAIKTLIKDETLRRKMRDENCVRIKNYGLQEILKNLQDLIIKRT